VPVRMEGRDGDKVDPPLDAYALDELGEGGSCQSVMGKGEGGRERGHDFLRTFPSEGQKPANLTPRSGGESWDTQAMSRLAPLLCPRCCRRKDM